MEALVSDAVSVHHFGHHGYKNGELVAQLND